MRRIFFIIFIFFNAVVMAGPSLEDFARHPQFIDVKLSPDGKLLAATMRSDEGRIELVVLDRTKNLQPISRSAFTGDSSIASFNWVSDFRLVFSLSREVGSLDRPISTGELFAMNADGKRQQALFGPTGPDKDRGSATVINWLPADDKHIVIYARPWSATEAFSTVYRLNTDTGRKRQLTRTPLRDAQVITDSQGLPRFAIGADPSKENETVIMSRGPSERDWQEISRFSTVSGGFLPLAFIEQDTKVLGLSDRQTDTKALTIWDLAKNQESVLYHKAEVDVMPVVSIKNGVANEVIGFTYEYDVPTIEFFDKVTDSRFRDDMVALVSAFAGKVININSATRDGNLMIVTVSSANEPSEFYFYDRINKQVSYLLNTRPWLAEYQLAKTESIFYQARDGQKIHALLTLPVDKEPKNLPLIMMPHGGPHGIRDSLVFDRQVKLLAQHGYAVLQPNFRGSGGFGKQFETAGYRNWGRVMIDDMTDGVQFLVKKEIVDPARMCTFGASYGGYAAVMSVIREPDLYRCAVGYVGAYDLALMYKSGDTRRFMSGMTYWETVLGRDESNLREQSPVHRVSELKVPVFIVHGAKDERVTIDHANALRSALDEKGLPYQWLVKPNEGHGFYNPENNVELWGQMLKFIADNMIEQSH